MKRKVEKNEVVVAEAFIAANRVLTLHFAAGQYPIDHEKLAGLRNRVARAEERLLVLLLARAMHGTASPALVAGNLLAKAALLFGPTTVG